MNDKGVELLDKIIHCVNMQAEDQTLWEPQSVGEDYLLQSLRWLHSVIENMDDSDKAYESIKEQWEDHK